MRSISTSIADACKVESLHIGAFTCTRDRQADDLIVFVVEKGHALSDIFAAPTAFLSIARRPTSS